MSTALRPAPSTRSGRIRVVTPPSDPPTADLERLAAEAAAAQGAWQLLAQTGGLSVVGDMAHRWDVGTETVRDYTKRATFPEPVTRLGRDRAWLTAEVELWRHGRRPPGRPRTRPQTA